MIVVDANVLVQLYRMGEHTAPAVALLGEEPDWGAPVLWRSEFRNALATHMRCGGLTLGLALRIQDEAEALMSGGEYDVDSNTVLRLAESSGCSAYDCEYVALAQKLGVQIGHARQAGAERLSGCRHRALTRRAASAGAPRGSCPPARRLPPRFLGGAAQVLPAHSPSSVSSSSVA